MMVSSRAPFGRILLVIFALLMAASSREPAFAASSPWVEGPKTKARLLAGRSAEGAGAPVLAFVEIALEPGWKTYWRTPGDAGGLPPSFDWSKSSNLAKADVLFPAPERFVDKSGTTIGYADGLVLPVAVTAKDPGLPVSLVVGVHYGICKDVCIPVEAELALDVAPEDASLAPAAALQALSHVPRAQGALRPEDPVVVRAAATLDEAAPKITVEARFPKGAAPDVAFLEAADGLFLPLAERVGPGRDDGVLFEAALGADVDLASLRGQTVTVTLVSDAGASYATFTAE